MTEERINPLKRFGEYRGIHTFMLEDSQGKFELELKLTNADKVEYVMAYQKENMTVMSQIMSRIIKNSYPDTDDAWLDDFLQVHSFEMNRQLLVKWGVVKKEQMDRLMKKVDEQIDGKQVTAEEKKT